MAATNTEDPKVRLDKWLWAARFYKTRALAKEAIEGGKVHYNSQRTKPGKIVETGARVSLRLGWQEKIVVVDDISDRRRGALAAQDQAGRPAAASPAPEQERPPGYPALPGPERPLEPARPAWFQALPRNLHPYRHHQ